MILTKVKEIKRGDIFPGPGGWTATTDAAHLHDLHCEVEVQYRDGGHGTREWRDPEHQIEVDRPGDETLVPR